MEIKQEEKKQIDEETSKTHRLEENKYNTIKIWKQKYNILSDGIMPKINLNKRIVKEALKKITGDNNEENNKIKNDNSRNKNELKFTASERNLNKVSPYTKKILKKINRHIKNIKEASEDIIAMNALYLDNIVQNITNRNNKRYKNNISISEYKKYSYTPNYKNVNNSQDNIYNDNNYRQAILKKERRNNFIFVNNNYRKQLNSAFRKYNPISHLNNLKILLQVSPSIREDVIKTKSEVEEDIKTLCDEHKYTKKLKTYLSKNIRSKSMEMGSPNPNNNKMNNINLIGNINYIVNNNKKSNINNKEKDENVDNSKNKPIFSFLPSISREKILGSSKELKVGYGIFAKLKRKESQKLSIIREQKIDEANKLYKITNEIDNFIRKKNIGEKIDKYIDDYNLQKYLCKLRENENGNTIKGVDYYKLQKEKINNMLGELYINTIHKRTNEREKYYNNRIRKEKKDYFIKINNELEKSIKDFDNNIILNEINLNPENPNYKST